MMPLKKPFTRSLSFQSFQAEIDFLIQLPFPPSHSNPGSFPQRDYVEALSLGSAVGGFRFGRFGGVFATCIKK